MTVMRRRFFWLAALPLAITVGCGSSSSSKPQTAPAPTTEAPIPTDTTPSAELDVPTGAPAVTPSPTDFGLDPGYPKVIPITAVPSEFAGDFPATQQVLVLAPNVYTSLPDGATETSAIEAGDLVGLCASVKTYTDAHPDQTHGSTCI